MKICNPDIYCYWHKFFTPHKIITTLKGLNISKFNPFRVVTAFIVLTTGYTAGYKNRRD
jgi:hypothetical protein